MYTESRLEEKLKPEMFRRTHEYKVLRASVAVIETEWDNLKKLIEKSIPVAAVVVQAIEESEQSSLGTAQRKKETSVFEKKLVLLRGPSLRLCVYRWKL